MRRCYGLHNIGNYLAKRDDGWICHYCGCVIHPDPDRVDCLRKPAQATVDHKTPLARGGKDEPKNMVLACQPCNREKGVMDYVLFRTLIRRRQKARR